MSKENDALYKLDITRSDLIDRKELLHMQLTELNKDLKDVPYGASSEVINDKRKVIVNKIKSIDGMLRKIKVQKVKISRDRNNYKAKAVTDHNKLMSGVSDIIQDLNNSAAHHAVTPAAKYIYEDVSKKLMNVIKNSRLKDEGLDDGSN